MKRVSSFLLLLMAVACASATAFSRPALAQGFSVRKNALPDASQVERSRLRMQIVDPSPIVTDTRKPQDSTTYVINVPPPPKGKNTVVQVGDGGTGNSGGQGSLPIQSNHLPGASFQSNIPPKGVGPNKTLPSGVSSKGLGQVAARKLPAPAGQNPAVSHAEAAPPVSPRVKMYDQAPSTTVSTINQRTKESVKGELRRGDLVRK